MPKHERESSEEAPRKRHNTTKSAVTSSTSAFGSSKDPALGPMSPHSTSSATAEADSDMEMATGHGIGKTRLSHNLTRTTEPATVRMEVFPPEITITAQVGEAGIATPPITPRYKHEVLPRSYPELTLLCDLRFLPSSTILHKNRSQYFIPATSSSNVIS
jgi:hypothetical protein